MTYEALTAYAVSHGRDISYLPMNDNLSMTFEDESGVMHIAINSTSHRRRKKSLLAHELGHTEHAGLYERYSPYVLRCRCEYRADKWSYFHACPPGEVRQAIQDGYREPWEFAELFDVDEEFMVQALQYYKRSGVIPDTWEK